MNIPEMPEKQIDEIWDAHADAPTMSFRYLVTEAILAARDAQYAAMAGQERAEPVAPAVEINPADLTIEMWPPRPTSGMIVGMSKGVKITHKPTGLYVTCDSKRSQHANRDKAYEQLCIVLSATPPAPAEGEAKP